MSDLSNLRVLHVVASLGMGGAETWLMEILRRRSPAARGQMDFVITSGKRGVFDDEAAALGARLYYLPFTRHRVLQFAKAFRALLRSERYDVIHDHSDCIAGWHFLAGMGVLPRVRISHLHRCWSSIEQHYTTSPARRFAAEAGRILVRQLATHICGTSEETLRQFGASRNWASGAEVDVVYCGLDLDRFAKPREPDRTAVRREFGFPAEAKIILFAGRFDWALELGHPDNHKNSWLAILTARAAAERDDKICFLLAGAGDNAMKRAQEHIAAWGLSDRLKLIGVRHDIDRLMRAADLLLFPSTTEGLGMVAVEAQAVGLPVLASTAVPREAIVIPELFEALPCSDPPEVWATAALAAISKRKLAVDACDACLRASEFSIDRSIGRLSEIYGSAG